MQVPGPNCSVWSCVAEIPLPADDCQVQDSFGSFVLGWYETASHYVRLLLGQPTIA